MKKFRTGWYLIYTKPRHEKKVHSHLLEKKINCFLPLKKTVRTFYDRRRSVDEPLFPSYVFIYLQDMQSYYGGIDTAGSLYYVRMGKEIARVSESVVDSIRLVTSQANDLEVSSNIFEPGRKFVISKGALTGLFCEMVELNKTQKLLVRVEILQRNLLLTLPKEYLIPS